MFEQNNADLGEATPFVWERARVICTMMSHT